jgi:translation initiation factor 5A
MQVHIPLIDKRTGQIISMTDAGIQVMDSETFETIDISLVEDEIKDKIQQGQDVEFWKVMDRTKIMRIKSS